MTFWVAEILDKLAREYLDGFDLLGGSLDLVSREEFDAQAKVLERSRDLIERLTERVAALERRQSP